MGMNSWPQAVVFDLDGVLIDSEAPSARELHALLRDEGVNCTLEDLRVLYGRPLPALKAFLLEHLGDEARAQDLRQAYNARARELIERGEFRAFPGVLELLSLLQRYRLPVALATSSVRSSALLKLKHAGLSRYFELIVTGDEVQNGKPAPDIFLRAAERLGAEPSLCLLVEDSHAGVTAGIAAKMTVWAVCTTHSEQELDSADTVFPDICALQAVLQEVLLSH